MKQSPVQPTLSVLSARPAVTAGVEIFDGLDDDEFAEQDEETLRLKLEAIQVKLRLKSCMNAKKRKDERASGSLPPCARAPGGTPGLQDAPNLPRCSNYTGSITRSTVRSDADSMKGSQADKSGNIEVPASPARETRPATGQLQLSSVTAPIPAERHVGSRVSNANRNIIDQESLERSTHKGRPITFSPLKNSGRDPPPLISFAERLTFARKEEDHREDKVNRIKASRTGAFSIGQDEVDMFKSQATIIPYRGHAAEPTPSFTREDIVGTAAKAQSKPNVKDAKIEASESLEPYSSVHLRSRILPHQALTRILSRKKIVLIEDLLRCVKAPDFELPEDECDIVVMAIIAAKSDPITHKSGENKVTMAGFNTEKSERGKFMVLTLVDLKYEIDLFLFNSAFSRFWRLPTGTLVAILNPGIMPPPPWKFDTGRFSLVVNSDADAILEVGTARDLGYCSAKKRDGQVCSQWVNLQRTQFCEWHINKAVNKKRVARMEVNSMHSISGRGRASRRGGCGRSLNLGNSKANEKYIPEYGSESTLGRDSKYYPEETHTKYFISTSMARSSLMDEDRSEPMSFAGKKEREEYLKRRRAREEREWDVARRLAQISGGRAGGQYLGRAAGSRAGSSSSSAPAATVADDDHGFRGVSTSTTALVCGSQSRPQEGQAQPPVRMAKSLGLLPTGKVDLSLKRKRPTANPVLSAATITSHTVSSPFAATKAFLGWGTSSQSKLSQMKELGMLKTEQQKVPAPVTKKARFLANSGVIKEAGKGSLSAQFMAKHLAAVPLGDGSDDDELVIIDK